MYVDILDKNLKPFIKNFYPDGHRFVQDNDPKHTSVYAKNWLAANRINWFKTPPESPDLNPIENLWHELKEFVRNEAKPTTKDMLVNAIVQFWQGVTSEKCKRYIGHLRKVVPAVIENNGGATRF